ncbi:Uncharacterized protein PECH_006955 [Penicillium ucsense]|uniref:F-box domain-containing protein n=1 Tax=Penicillium ucsense TaxID=2839758 RepID=A0A8J8WKK0_9EURO|nr:Uncharacterized protein PECM_005072 [Penicillium ucsense]KAF7738996.1 Uncharacterized protein PECH_006955 [Penicillium ucsense]
MQSRMEGLPTELLDWIISYLNQSPPSERRVYREPEQTITESPDRSLKHLSATCSRFASLIRPHLFTHARLGPREDWSDFRRFVTEWDLSQHVTSLVISFPSEYQTQFSLRDWVTRLFDFLDPKRLTILAPPRIIGDMLHTAINEEDGWAFEIDLQILQLTQEGYGNPSAHQTTNHTKRRSMVLNLRPWTTFLFNESTSLRAYNHYEYFLSQVPSVLGQWGQGSLPMAPGPELTAHFHHLQDLTYTAVFPFYNHVDHVCSAMDYMPRLRKVTVQLAPESGNRATELEQRGSMDPNDPWMELESSYSVMVFKVRAKSSVTEFHSRDYHVEAVRSSLMEIMSGELLGWTHDGQGSWRRPKSEAM